MAQAVGLPPPSEPDHPWARAETELALSKALAEAELGPKAGPVLAYVDPDLVPPKGRARLEAAAAAPDLSAHLSAAFAAQNPIAVRLERALERHRASRAAGLIPIADGSDRTEQALLASLERARALPADFGKRFILVDAAAGRMWFYDEGSLVQTMKVVTGKPSQPTPMMAAMARHLVFNPYWNVPEDLVRTSIAPKVLEQGLAYVRDEGLEVLSDYSESAVPLDPAQVDWQGVRDGTVTVRVRQRPGPKNMMGQVKLMLPNPLGIYLHDTPHKGDFARSERLASSGCVRLEDAMTLARLLVGPERAAAALAAGGEEARIDLPEPIPVYITYFTAMPDGDRVELRPDPYGRDAAWLAQHAGAAQAGGSAP